MSELSPVIFQTQRTLHCACRSLLVAAIVMMTIGCERDGADTELETESGETIQDPAQVPQANRIDVTLDDFVIEMPDTMNAGIIAFIATNRGTVEHSLEVENGDVHQRIPADFGPGETMELLVELGPGTYRAYCPVEDHADRGMEKQIVVR